MRCCATRRAGQRSNPLPRAESKQRQPNKEKSRRRSLAGIRLLQTCSSLWQTNVSQMIKYSSTQIKAIADRAEARSRGAIDDDDAEWERGFGDTCDKARHERSLEIIEAEIKRLALLQMRKVRETS